MREWACEDRKGVDWYCGGGLADDPFTVVSAGSMTMDPDDCPWDCKCDEVLVAPFRDE